MGKNIIILNGSPRPNGNTSALTAAFKKGAEEAGNKVTEFTEDWVQDKFGGAFVLVPQCDTMWLDDGSHQYGDSGKSMYTEALKYLIDEFIDRFSAVIDPERVYIGGDSNGGFMTMLKNN